jgi:AbrB family looped-hinge helix DNA binding protein
MQVVKVLPKGQITLPKKVRKKFDIKIGDSLILEEEKDRIVLRKGKTIFDYIGTLPNLGMDIKEIREKAIEEATKERCSKHL